MAESRIKWHIYGVALVLVGLFVVNLTTSQRNRSRRKKVERELKRMEQRVGELEKSNAELREQVEKLREK